MGGKNRLFISDRPPGVWGKELTLYILIRAVKKHSPPGSFEALADFAAYER